MLCHIDYINNLYVVIEVIGIKLCNLFNRYLIAFQHSLNNNTLIIIVVLYIVDI